MCIAVRVIGWWSSSSTLSHGLGICPPVNLLGGSCVNLLQANARVGITQTVSLSVNMSMCFSREQTAST